MFKLYSDSGFSTIALTPHIYHPTVLCKVQNIRSNFAEAEEIAKKYNLQVILGSELYLEGQTDILTIPIANKYALFELPIMSKPMALELKIKKVIDLGLIPIVAHIERYGWMDCNSPELDLFYNLGCLIQVNVCGIENKTALPYIKKGVVDIIASDNHGEITLPSRLKRCLDSYPEILQRMQDLDFE